jgi:undecaprenyl-diphosphatase
MAWALLIGGVVMWIVDALFSHGATDRMEDMRVGQAVWIGAAQILSAVFPGTSRSMSTIAAGELAGLTRPAALEFSFFVSMPTMVVATLYDLLKAVRPGHRDAADALLAPHAIHGHEWVVLAIGFAVSLVVALAVVAWFMRWVRARGFTLFAIYRIVIGLVLLVALARGWR